MDAMDDHASLLVRAPAWWLLCVVIRTAFGKIVTDVVSNHVVATTLRIRGRRCVLSGRQHHVHALTRG